RQGDRARVRSQDRAEARPEGARRVGAFAVRGLHFGLLRRGIHAPPWRAPRPWARGRASARPGATVSFPAGQAAASPVTAALRTGRPCMGGRAWIAPGCLALAALA